MSALRRRPNRRLLTTSAFGALALAAVWAAPAHAQLVQGAVPAQSNGAGPTIDQSVPNTTTVTLGGSRTVIDWDKFDVNSGDTANFVFANRSDIVLNRVGGAGSTINGNLNGTIGSAGGPTGGNIWIYNANGVVIGANARVSTGGLLVTTAAVDRATDSSAGGFLDGSSTSFGFTGAGTGNITVQNGAQITSHGGAIALVAPVVTTEAGSSISAQDGSNVLVGSAAKYQISFRPTSTDDMDLLSFEVADGAGTSGTDAINLAGNIGGNRVFVAAVSKSGLVASIVNTGTISATTAATDETGAIVLSANHDIVNGAAAAAPLSGIGEGYVTTTGGAVTGPKVDFVASENVLLRGNVGEAGAIVNLRSDNTDIKQFAGVITADTLTASAHTGINFNSFDINRVDKLGAFSTDTGDLTYLGDEDGVEITGLISAPGKVTLGARGFMDTTTGSITASSLEFSLGGGGSFKVNGDANIGYAQSQGAVTIKATGGITLSNEFQMLLGDTMTLTADAGPIRETGGFISGGGAVVADALGEIDLSGANSFTSLTANSNDGERITVNATGNLDFKASTTGAATVHAGNGMTASGVNAINVGTLALSAGGAISLSVTGGDVGSFGALSTGGSLSIAIDGDIKLADTVSAGTLMSLTSRNGAILQTGGTISLASVYALYAATGIDLNQAGNHLGNAGSFVSEATSGTGSNVRIRSDALNLNFHGTLGDVSLYGDSGNVFVNSGLVADSLTVEAAGDMSIGNQINKADVTTYHRLLGTNISVWNDGDFTVDGDVGRADVGRVELVTPNGTLTQAAGTIFGADVSLRAAYAINQDSGASVQAAGGIFEAVAGTDLQFTGANRFGLSPLFTWGTNANVTIRSVGDLYVDNITTLGWLVPVHALKLISDEGNVGVYGGFTADTLNVAAHGDIILDDATYIVNNVGSVTGLTSATGSISLREDDGFTVDGDIRAAGGNITLKSDGAIGTYNGATLSLGGTLAVTAGGDVALGGLGTIKLGAVDTTPGSGGSFFLTTDGDIDLTGTVNTGSKNLTLESTAGAITSHGGTVSTQYNGFGGIVTASANGGIDLTSVGSAVFWATSTGGGDIKLSSDNDVGFMVNTTGDVTVTAGGWAGNSSDVVARSLGISAGTGISLYDQSVNIDVGSYRYLTVADGYIDIENQRDIKLDGSVTTGGSDPNNWVRLNSTNGSILQNSGTIKGYQVELKAIGSVTQDAAAKIVTGDYGLLFTGTDVFLRGANEISGFQAYSVSRDLTLRNHGTLDLSGGSNQVSGTRNVTLISDTGDVIGGYIDADKLSASALNGKLVLNNGSNTIDSLGALTAKSTAGVDINIYTNTLLGLTDNITGGGVNLYATVGINQTGGAIIADRLATGTAGNLLLGGANNFGALLDAGHANNATVTIRNLGDIVLPGTPNSFGTLTLTSDTGGIGQTSAINVATLNAHAVTGIDLSNTSNNFTTLTGLAATGTGASIRIGDTGGFAIEGNITAPGTVALASTGNITTGTTTVGVVTTPHGKVDADTLTVSATNATVYTANDIKLGASSVSSGFTLIADGSIDFAATSNFNLASLIATSGSITQSGGILTGNTVLTGASGSITLDKANTLADFGGTSTGGGTVTLNNVRTSTLSLSLNTTGNAVVTAAGDVLGSFINVGDLSLTAGAIDLRTNVNVSSFSKLIAAYGDVLVTNAGSFTIAGDVSASTAGLRSVNLQSSGGGISQTGGTISANDVTLSGLLGFGNLTQSGTARVVTNAISLSGFNVLLGGANSFTSGHVTVGVNLTLRNAGAINLDALGGYTSGGTLSLTSDNGSITSSNAVSTFFLTALAANGGVSFDNASNSIVAIGGLRALTNATIRTSGTLVLNGDLSVGSVLQLYAGTGISQATDTITAGQLDARVSGAGSIALGGANDVDAVYVLDALGDVSFRDVDGFDIQGNVVGDHVTLNTDAGAIYERVGSRLIANHLTASAATGLQLNQVGNAIQYIDGLTLTGAAENAINVASTGGDLHLAGNVAGAGQYVFFYVGGGSFIQDSGTIAAGNLAFIVPDGSVTLGANDVGSLGNMSIGGDFISTANLSTGVLGVDGNIVANGTITIRNAAGILEGGGGAFNANTLNLITAGTLTADNFANSVNNANIQMGSGSFHNYGDFRLQLAATGAASITSGGSITFDGSAASTADTLSLGAATGIFSATGIGGKITVNHLGDVTSGSGGVALVSTGGFDLTGNITATGQTVSLTGDGNLLQGNGGVTADTLTVDVGHNLAYFTQPNHVAKLGKITATLGFRLDNVGDLALTDLVNAGAGQIDLHTDGALSETGSGAITAEGLAARAGTTLALESTANQVSWLNGLSGTSVSYFNGAGLSVGGDITATAGNVMLVVVQPGDFLQTAGTISGQNLTLRSDNGNFVQSGAARFVATGTLTAAAAGNLLLGGANDFNSAGATFLYGPNGDVTIRNLGGINFTGNSAIDALSLTSDTGAISQTGAVTANSITASAATGITLTDAGNAIGAVTGLSNSGSNGIAFTSSGYTLGGNVAALGQTVSLVATSGAITQNSGAITANRLNASAVTGISLTGSANDVAALGNLSNSGTGGIAYTDANSYNITGNITAAGQALSLASGDSLAGVIQQSNAGSLITAGTLNVTGAGAADLQGPSHAGNAIAALGNVSSQLSLTTTGALDLTGDIATDYLQLRAGGAITQSGGHIVNASSSSQYLIQGTSIALTSATNQLGRIEALFADRGTVPGNVALVSTGNVQLGDITADTLSLTTTGNIGAIGGGIRNLDTFAADAGGTIAFDGNFSKLGNITGFGDASLASTGDLDLHGTINIDTGQLTLTSGGAITTLGGSVSAGALLASAQTGISLAYIHVGSLKGLTTAGGDILFMSDNGFTIDGDVNSGSGSTAFFVAGGITQNSGIITAGTLSIDATSDVDLTQTNQVGAFGAVSTGLGFFHFTNAGNIVLGNGWGVGGDIVLTSGGAITQMGGISASSLTASAVDGIRFDYGGNNNIAVIGGLSNSGTGGIYLANNSGFTITGNVSAAGQAIQLFSNFAIVQDSGSTITARELTVSGRNGISLTSLTNDVAEIKQLSSLGSIAYTGANNFTLTGDVYAASQEARLTSVAGGIAQSDGIITASNIVADAAGSIVLDKENDIGGTVASAFSSSAGDISFHSVNAILLGTVSTPGLLSLTSDAGGIGQTIAISAGAVSATSLQGDIILDQNNAIGTVKDITTDGVFTFNAAGNLTLDGTITAPDRVKLTAAGNITQIGTGAIHSDILQATSGAGALNGISLLNHNDVAQATLNSNGKDLRFRNTGDFELGNISAAGHIVEMISDTGSVTQLAGTSILAGTFSATGTNVVLDNTGNQISRIGLIATGSDLSLRNTVALQIDRIDAAGHAVTINNADNIIGGNITADKLTLGITGGYVDLSNASHVASLGGFTGTQLGFVNDGSFTISGAIQNGMYQTFLTSRHGAISMAAGGSVNSGGLTVQAATGVSITGNMSNIYGAASTTGDVSLISSMLLDIQGDISGDTVTLGGLANGGYVGQTSGSITANLLNASGNAYVDLSGATNHIAALGTLNSNDYIRVSSLDAVTLTGNIDSGSIVTLNAGGAISQTGGRIQAWGLNATAAGDLDLGATNLIVNNGDVILAGDNVTFANDGTFTVAGITAASIGAIDLTSINGSILQSGAMSGGSLTASAQGALTLGQYNSIGTIGKLSAGTHLTYAGFSSFALTDDITAGASVTLDSGGGGEITQSAGIITADTLNVRAGKAVLGQANQVAKLGWVSMSNYGLSFRNVGDIDLSDSVNSSHLGLYSDTGSITQSGGSISASWIDMSAAGNIELLNGSYYYIDQLVSANGDITLRNGGSIDSANLISAAHGAVDITANAVKTDAVVADRLTVTANAFGDVVMLGANRIGEIGDVRGMNVSLGVDETLLTGLIQASQSLTFAGSTSATAMSLTQSASAGINTPKLTINDGGLSGNVVLSQLIHSNTGELDLSVTTGGSADIRTDGAINLLRASVGEDLSLRAAGSILTGGTGPKNVGGTLSAVTSGNDIMLQFDTVGHVGDLSSAYSVSLSASNLDLTGAVNATTLSLGAYAGSLTQSAGSSVTATTLMASADGNLLLDGSNSIGTIYALGAGGDVSFRSVGALYFLGYVAAGSNSTISLTAGGDITAAGLSITGGTLNVDAAGHTVSLGQPTTSASIATLGDVTADNFELYSTGSLGLSGTQNVAGTLGLTVNGALTQSSGGITADRLNLSAASIDLRRQNLVNTLSVSGTPSGFVRFANLRDLTVDGAIQAGGDLSLDVDGDLTAASGLFANGAVDLLANGVEVSRISSGGAVSVTGDGNVTVGALDMTGDGANAVLSGQDVTLGAASGPITGANYVNFGGTTPGSVSIQASGNATVRINDTNMAIGIAAAGDVNAESNNQLLLGDVSGANITLLAGTSLSAGSIATPGVYSVTAGDIGAFSIDRTNGDPLDILITDTDGDLTLSGDIVARRNTTINAVGDVIGGSARLGAGLTMDGTLTVNGGNIALAEASSLYDVVLNGTGAVDVGTVYVGRDYSLTGNSFAGSALVPIGTQTGTWTLTGLSDLDLGAATIQYNGDIDFHVDGMLSNGTIQSRYGAVTGSAGVIDLQELLAATDIDAESTAGAFRIFHASAGTGNLTLLGRLSLTVDGSVEAAGDVGLSAQYGTTTIGYASAGANISVFSLFGNAILRQASLTGATGNLNVQSVTGTATLGADDYASIGTDNYFERAAGSTGTASVVGAGHANVHLDHSAALDLIRANTVWAEARQGDLSIDTLAAITGDATAIAGGGSLFVNAAQGVGLLLTARGGNLTLGGAGITADGITLVADGILDTTAVGNLSGQALDLAGGTIRAASLTATGDAQLSSTTGGITMNNLTVGGEVFVTAFGNLTMNQVSVGDFSNFVADGDLTVRSVSAQNGFWLTGQGNITLGADAGMLATSDNYVAVGGTLGNCGCVTGGATILSLGGNVSVNLLGATGVFDGARANLGNVSLSIGSGDLGIGVLKGHDITASTPGVLTVMDVESSGGSYSLTAADFGGFALSPVLFGGATSLGDVTIIDTDGDLNSGGALTSSGNIRVEAQGGAITGGLSLSAIGDVTAIGQGVALQQVTGRDVTIDAGTGTVELSGTLNVGRDYTLTGGDFSGSTLWPSGGTGGSLTITDTLGDFAFGGNDFTAGGGISISALHGLLSVGNLQAGDAVMLTAGTDLSLVSAKLTGTGGTAFSLVAGGDLRFGAADAASIVSGNVFSHAGQAPTGTSIRAGGSVTMNLYRADGLGAIEGGAVRIVVAAGDFSAGDIDAVGALSVQGPSGRLTLGDLTTSGGHIDVSGQGNTVLGDVTGPSVVNLGASAGNLDVGSVTGGDVSFLVAGGINAASVSADTLGVVAVNGNVDLDHGGAGSNVARLGTITVNNGDFTLRNLQGLGLDGIVEVHGTLDLQLAGALAQNAYYIVADRLQGSATGAVTLAGDNRIATLGSWSSNGFRFSNATALTIDGTVDAGSGAAVIASHGGLEIGIGGNIVSSATGDAITLASDGLFANRAGAGALDTPNGRWLVYTQTGGTPGVSDPNNDFGGLAGTSYYGDAYDFGTGSFATAPNPGNRFVYGYRPVLTVTPSSLHLVYDGTTPVVTATVTGMVNGDTGPNVWSGAADISGVGPNAGTYFAYSTLGTLTSEMGYRFTFVPGTVVIDPRVISAILTANDRSYDGTLGATGTLGLSGVIAGDTVSVNGTGMAFADRNAGTHLVTASGITLSGADAGNYVLAATSVTDLAAILAKAITATLSANGKTYDGTTAATGSLSLGGLVGTDQVSANGSYAFDSRNVGTRTVTASGIALSGADAGNYVLTGTSATAVADILARAISATLSANGKTYDGTTAATGSLSLGGLVGTDQVSANGSYAFDSRNAGTRTVTASGIALSGADAGNYVLTGTSATALADILARAISATLTANDRSYDGTTAATGTLGLSGVVAGDAVSASGTGMVFDGKNAGIGRTVTASGISLSGADAGNYTILNTTATDLADILAKAITATLAVNGRVYDGTTAATGTLGLNGVVAGDQVGVTAGGIAFDSRNAGTRTATASGLALNGGDAGNYTISGTASGNAVISPKAITATATADSRDYDGTTAATGRIALTGLISGDTVTGTASYRFADANAGTGRTVQVSGLALSGADAANYTVTLSTTPVTADITRRAVTVTVKDLTKILGQPDPAFAYAVTGGSVVSGDSFSGALVRAAGEQAGRYAIGQGTLALSSNYLLTVVPGTLAITLTQSGAEASDALKTLQVGVGPGFSLDQNPSRNLEGDDQGEDGDDGDK